MTDAVNLRKQSNQHAKKEIEKLGLPQVVNPKHVESAIQIQSLLERLNGRYLRPSTYAEQLYSDVQRLIETNQTLERAVAQLIIEEADDALKEFGNTHQQQKLQLREWKSRAESALAPKTLKDLRERAEAGMLSRAWRGPITRKAIVALALLVVVVGFITYVLSLMPTARCLQAPRHLKYQHPQYRRLRRMLPYRRSQLQIRWCVLQFFQQHRTAFVRATKNPKQHSRERSLFPQVRSRLKAALSVTSLHSA